MATTSGALSAGTVGTTSAEVITAPASGGTTPYTYQLYRSLTSGFTPGGGNIIAGATTLDYVDTGLIPGTQYYYKSIVVDSSGTPVAATSAQLAVLTETGNQNMNQFSQSPFLGMLDLYYNYNTISAQLDAAASGAYIAGTAMKYAQTVGGVPKIVPCTANTDVVAGFITYNIKNKSFTAYDYCELSQTGNIMYLMATAAIQRGQQVMIDPSTVGGVTPATTGKPICGYAQDVATAGGQLIRVELLTPAYRTLP